MTLPNVILGGSQKCGTSSLFDVLAAHPQCHASQPKEPTYFSREAALADLDPYRACFAIDPPASPAVVFEGSTAYLPDPAVPERVARTLGLGVRWVFLLRHPAERAVSAYFHTLKRGDERRRLDQCLKVGEGTDLDTQLDQERHNLQRAVAEGAVDLDRYQKRYDDPTWTFHYLANSAYSRQLEPYLRIFGRDKLHLMSLEQLLEQPGETLGRLAGFLEIDARAMPRRFVQHSNQTQLPRQDLPGRLAELLTRGRTGSTLRRRMPSMAARLADLRTKPKPVVDATILRNLYRLFSDEESRLMQQMDGKLPPLGWPALPS